MGDCLKVGTRARGTIPNKVSDLENDLKFVTEKQLDKVIIEAQAGYHGLENETAKVEVDNLNRTIEVIAKYDDLKKTLPKDSQGYYIQGTYSLSAIVDNLGKVRFVWSSSGPIVTAPYYYGVTNKSISEITPAEILSLPTDGTAMGDREYTFNPVRERVIFACPANFGELDKIVLISVMDFDVTDSFQKLTMTLNGVDYYIYVSYNSSTGSYNYKFKY